ncbi:MAG: WGR domain-containing protein [Cytophagales bacterium]|nr:WGR domain-containing protein [Cytophagales bacterium]
MFKKIINSLLGNTGGGGAPGRAATIEEVRAATYDLMARNGSTTTLDVKNELRLLNFQAFQDQVSQMVSAIASHDQLSSRNSGRYNVYFYGTDTAESRHVYLQSGDQFWEGRVDGKAVTLYAGRVGTDGTEDAFACYKNLLAVRELERLADEKTRSGYAPAADPRPPLAVRRQYGHLFGQRPVVCSIGYYNVVKKELSDGQWVTKNAGYRFTWHLLESHAQVAGALSGPTWNSGDVRFDGAQLLGEKLVGRQPADLPAAALRLEVDNGHLYEVEISFQNGSTAILSKFQPDLQGALLPLARRLLAVAG